jgi:hypothetical protein
MAAEWSLVYDCLGEEQAVPFVDETSIDRTLRQLDGVETSWCQLANELYPNMVCRGGPDKFVVQYAGIPPGCHRSPGCARVQIFLLGRKNDTDSRVVRVRWKTKPVVFVDVRAHVVLTLSEAITVFNTFFTTTTVHQASSTIPKPLNGYLT